MDKDKSLIVGITNFHDLGNKIADMIIAVGEACSDLGDLRCGCNRFDMDGKERNDTIIAAECIAVWPTSQLNVVKI